MRKRVGLLAAAGLLVVFAGVMRGCLQPTPQLSHPAPVPPPAAGIRHTSGRATRPFWSARLPNDTVLEFESSRDEPFAEDVLVLRRGGQPEERLPLHSVLEDWLRDEERWGGRGPVNAARWERNRDNLTGIIHTARVEGAAVFIEIQWCLTGASMNDVRARQLARVRIEPNLRIDYVRWLPGPDGTMPTPLRDNVARGLPPAGG